MKKLRVAVLYGGRSGEHEVSLRSGASVIRNLDRTKYEVIPVAIDKDGRWRLGDLSRIDPNEPSLPIFKDGPAVVLPPNPPNSMKSQSALLPLGNAKAADVPFDVVFPVMHGPLCEDGTLQGLLELADVPYVGCGVLASSAGMDKDMTKRIIRDAGLPVVPWIALKEDAWKRNKAALASRVAKEIGYPAFVKPANQGSSVGVHKVKESSALDAALADAFRYDSKILIEKSIDAREVEVSVLENIESTAQPLVSIPGEITPSHEFYSYEAKYLDENGAALNIPAKLSSDQTKLVQKIAHDAFLALECEGMTRVDMFLDRNTGEIYFNEVNTIPGFTSISMFPKMWEASGIGYKELLTKLVDLAVSRHEKKRKLVREFHQG